MPWTASSISAATSSSRSTAPTDVAALADAVHAGH
jgi:hypothetical protein